MDVGCGEVFVAVSVNVLFDVGLQSAFAINVMVNGKMVLWSINHTIVKLI